MTDEAIRIQLDDQERQLLLLALAVAAIQRPGFISACREIAKKLKGEAMFDDFMRYNLPPTADAEDDTLRMDWIASRAAEVTCTVNEQNELEWLVSTGPVARGGGKTIREAVDEARKQ